MVLKTIRTQWKMSSWGGRAWQLRMPVLRGPTWLQRQGLIGWGWMQLKAQWKWQKSGKLRRVWQEMLEPRIAWGSCRELCAVRSQAGGSPHMGRWCGVSCQRPSKTKNCLVWEVRVRSEEKGVLWQDRLRNQK